MCHDKLVDQGIVQKQNSEKVWSFAKPGASESSKKPNIYFGKVLGFFFGKIPDFAKPGVSEGSKKTKHLFWKSTGFFCW